MRSGREQPCESLGAITVHGHPPHPPLRVPAAPGNRPQELTQALVIGEAQDRGAVLERGVECRGQGQQRIWPNADGPVAEQHARGAERYGLARVCDPID
jgi:hypothetical protein